MAGRRARRGAASAAGLAAVVAWVFAAPPALAAPANFAGASSSGDVVVFTTTEKLVPGDTDSRLDVYERSYDDALESYVTREVSTGPTGGNDAFDAGYDGISADGDFVFFSTDESLLKEDADRKEDVYARNLETGKTSLVSAGESACAPACGNGPADAIFAATAGGGNEVVFITTERLAPDDTDDALDVYVRDLAASSTRLASAGPSSCAPGCGNGPAAAVFQGVSANGEIVLFSTAEQLVAPQDGDGVEDIYARDLASGETFLVSLPGTCPEGLDCTPVYGGVSSDGLHVFFETNERVAGAGDSDSASDVYDWSAGAATLVSVGPQGGSGPGNVTYEGSSVDGEAVFFQTPESLVSEDEDESTDVYERAGGATTLVSTGPAGGDGAFPATFDRASADGSVALFSTDEALTEDDTDSATDVYKRAGETTLVSVGPGGNGSSRAIFAGASADASRVFFETRDALVAEDDDEETTDLYARAGSATTLVSTGPAGHNRPFAPNLAGLSADGANAFFTTEERLTEGDGDTERDVYDRSAAGTLLVSVGNSIVVGPPTPRLTGTNPASPNGSTEPAVLGEAEPGSSIKLYSTPDCSGAPAAVGAVDELEGAGIPVTVEPGSTTTFRATATDGSGDTSGCSTTSVTYRQAEEAAGGGGGAGGAGGGSGDQGGGGQGGEGSRPPDGEPHLTPRTRITLGPALKTRARRPGFRFVDATGQSGTTFICRVDRRPWRRCRSPQRLKRLRPGWHVFRIKGFNSGLWEQRAVRRKFKVVRG